MEYHARGNLGSLYVCLRILKLNASQISPVSCSTLCIVMCAMLCYVIHSRDSLPYLYIQKLCVYPGSWKCVHPMVPIDGYHSTNTIQANHTNPSSPQARIHALRYPYNSFPKPNAAFSWTPSTAFDSINTYSIIPRNLTSREVSLVFIRSLILKIIHQLHQSPCTSFFKMPHQTFRLAIIG